MDVRSYPHRRRRPGTLAAGLMLILATGASAAAPDLYRIPDLKALQNTFENLAERVKPSAVAIRTYRYLGLPTTGEKPTFAKTPHSFGSGVVIRSDGLILTNQHVVADADVIKVVLFNRNEYEAKIVQQDVRSDLAVLRIGAKPLRAATFGDVLDVRVGHWCFAVGNPFGIAYDDGDPTVTVGNVSAMGRSLTRELGGSDTRYYGDLIQTSSPINPGNSGGPLFDIDGRVIGIITAIVSRSGVTEGSGFAIPICKRTRGIIDTLVTGRRVCYGYLGVEVPPASARPADGKPPIRGALIWGIKPDDGPAAKANLRADDIIVEFADTPIESSDQLVRVVGMTPVGAQVKVRYIRDGVPGETVVTLAERPSPSEQFRPVADSGVRTLRWKGTLLAEMNDATLRLHSLTRPEAGIVVTKVDRGSAARKGGLRPDDIILRCNGTRVRSLVDFAKVQARNPRNIKLDLLSGKTLRLRR